MSTVSREQIEIKVRELIAQEGFSLDDLQLDDIQLDENDGSVNLKTLLVELATIRTEFKQMNRLEKSRLDALKDYFEEESNSKQKLIENVSALVSKTAYSEHKALLLSIVEIRDYVETFYHALSMVFKGKNAVSSLILRWFAKAAFKYVYENVQKTLKKIDQLLEKANVYPIITENVTFDPKQMITVESLTNRNMPDHQVLETVERGFLQNDNVLRLAKVKVNKT